jgi:hypothetical protein
MGGDTTECIAQEQPTGLRIAIALDKAIVPLLSMFNRGISGPVFSFDTFSQPTRTMRPAAAHCTLLLGLAIVTKTY